MIREERFYAGGEWVKPARSAAISVVDPWLGEPLGAVPKGAAGDARVAVHAARWAFDEGPWPRMSGAERAAALGRLCAQLVVRRDALTGLAVRAGGIPVSHADSLVASALEAAAWYAERATRDFETRLPDHAGPPPASSLVVRDPLGVVAVLGASCEPLSAFAHAAVPALAVGNTVVYKPSSAAPLEAFEIARAAEAAGLPPGALNVVAGLGRDAGAELTASTLVDGIALSGRIATGRRVAGRAAASLKRLLLTLGASGTALVLDGADPADVASRILAAVVPTAGRARGAPCRVVVARALADELVDALTHRVKGLVLGDPRAPETDVGPLPSAKARERAEAMIRDAEESGGRLLAGGSKPEGAGFALEPAIVLDPSSGARMLREEISAPVLCVSVADGDDDAVRMVNDRMDGACTLVWAGSRERAIAVGRRVRSATVLVEGASANPWAPAGGYGHAGIGRERGLAGMEAFTEVKHLGAPG